MDADDAELERSLQRQRARRQRMAQVIMAALLFPFAFQVLFVWTGAAANYGLIVVVLPLAVAWIIRRGRR